MPKDRMKRVDELTRRASKQDRIGNFFLYLFVIYVMAVLGFLTYQELVNSYKAQQRLESALNNVQEQHLVIEKYIKCALLIPHSQRTEEAINACSQGDLKLTSTDSVTKPDSQPNQSVQYSQPIAPIPEQPKPVTRSSSSNKETSDQPDRPAAPKESYSGLQAFKNIIKGVKDGLQIHN